MGFWIFMTIMNLLIPIIMIGFGSYSSKNAPKQINHTFGYRTSMSMKNKETWEFAHHHSGRIWLKVGWIMLIVSGIAMLFVIGNDINIVGIFGMILCVIQVIVLIASIIPTEKALKRNFDENGNRRR